MPYSPNVNSYHELSVRGVYDTQEIFNVWHYFFTRQDPAAPSPMPGGSSAILEAFRAIYRAQVLPLLSDGYYVVQYILREILLPVAPVVPPKWNFTDQDVLPGEGADSGTGGIASTASFLAVNTWLTGTPYNRSGRGRKSMGPIPESQTDNAESFGNYLTDAARASWQSAMTVMTSDVVFGGAPNTYRISPRIGSLKNYVAAAATNLIFRPITATTVRPAMGSQVSRKQRNT